jgi:hypothetical protein
MRLLHRPMRSKDVKDCAALLASDAEEHRRYGHLLDKAPAAWSALLRTESMLAMVLEDQDCVPAKLISCGISVFVTDEFVRELKAGPLKWIGPELTLHASRPEPCFLNRDAVRRANSCGGLNLLVWVGLGRPAGPEDGSALAMEIMRVFVENHEGYWIKEILAQPNAIGPIRFTMNSGMSVWDPLSRSYKDGRSWLDADFQSPFLLGATSETSLAQLGNRTSVLFMSRRPTIFFRPSEQRLLLAALRGLTDEELADELTVSRSAVKKTWRAVYGRASCVFPNEIPAETSNGQLEARRGKEKKQRLLSYLREHREELRPILPMEKTERRSA